MPLAKQLSVAVVGLGMWGEKLVRVATHLGMETHGFDLNRSRADAVRGMYPELFVHASYEDILSDSDILAVIIATSPSTHFDLAFRALNAGKHVLVEKPMTQDVRQAGILTRRARRLKRILMVDHTYTHSPALREVRRAVSKGEIGRITRIESVRLGSRGLSDSTVLWDLAPHDAAIAHMLLGKNPLAVRTLAVPFSGPSSPDDATIELNFPDNVRYVAHLSWNNPVKERMLTVIGSQGAFALRWEGKKETLIRYDGLRKVSVPTPDREPLSEMLSAFAGSVFRKTHDSSAELDDYYFNVRVVAALHRSWKRHGTPIRL